jgi:transcriptional regulator with XRE-family HTH domain
MVVEMGVIEMDMEQQLLWDRITAIARERGKPAYLLLQLVGISAATIKLLREGYIPKRQATRQRIAEALGVSPDELFGRD